MRILHAPANIANQAWYAAKGLRALGHEVEVWEYDTNRFGFPVDRAIDTSSHDTKMVFDLLTEAIQRFDVFHFHFARTLIPSWVPMPFLWDLPLLRMLGKKVFMTFHGSEIRVRKIHEEYTPWSYFRFSDLDVDDDLVTKRTQVIRTFVDRMFVVSTDYFPFVPDAEWMPRIIDLTEWPEQEPSIRPVPQVLHIPSRRGKKGTEMILEGLEALKREGVPFDLTLVEDVPHDEARARIRAADIVIDNVLTGDYELVSMETMASSRVAVSYISDAVLDSFGGDVPVYNVNPATFVERMRDLITDRPMCLDLASRGRAHVARIHDAPVVAAMLADRYASTGTKGSSRAFPDWYSSGDERKVERLEERAATLATDRARLTKVNAVLRERLARLDRRSRRLDSVKGLLPPAARKRLRALRRRAGR
ncbi:MAG: hypothetical protein WAT66_07730 [Actinomycetota bacterium]